MKLKSGREVVEIQRDGYSEVLPTDGNSLLTQAEWDEYSSRTIAANRRKLAQQKIDRVKANRALFNADRDSRFTDPAYLKAERSVARSEKAIRRSVNN